MYPTTLYATPVGAFCGGLHVSTLYCTPLIFCVFSVALFAAAPFRNPQGVTQISICCAQSGVCALTTWLYARIGGSAPPRTSAGGCASPDARDAGAMKSIVRR